jgi:hypothetical protein
MQNRQADAGNWQARGQEFQVGQTVALINGGATDQGRVVATWPGIGMVDVQWPHTAYRHPVESLQIVNPGDDSYVSPMHEDVPGGPGMNGMVSEGGPQSNVVEGDVPRVELVHEVESLSHKVASKKEMTQRVAQAFVKKSLYWHALDRKYRASRAEQASGSYCCPKRGCGGHLRRATYKMENGCCVKLHACPACMFMIKSSDIMSDTGEGGAV